MLLCNNGKHQYQQSAYKQHWPSGLFKSNQVTGRETPQCCIAKQYLIILENGLLHTGLA
jgi:hypothetical protein